MNTMPIPFSRVEQQFFRMLNAVAEPAIRRGFGSLTFAPASLLVLESTGFKSGLTRRTPLWSAGIGPFRLVSTARGDRSFWVKNLYFEPAVSFYLGGRKRSARALVIANGEFSRDIDDLPKPLQTLAHAIADFQPAGWACALLIPTKR